MLRSLFVLFALCSLCVHGFQVSRVAARAALPKAHSKRISSSAAASVLRHRPSLCVSCASASVSVSVPLSSPAIDTATAGNDTHTAAPVSVPVPVPVTAAKPKAGEMFAKYGAAYLLTSITLSLLSFGTFYFLLSRGVDVAALLAKVGIEASASTAHTGTAAIAYAMHKAASPIRFPPTVALTPLVAQWIGYKPKAKPSNDATTTDNNNNTNTTAVNNNTTTATAGDGKTSGSI